MKFVKGPDYETQITKENKNEAKEESKLGEKTEVLEIPDPLVTHANKISRSIFFNVDVYINNQQLYISNGF